MTFRTDGDRPSIASACYEADMGDETKDAVTTGAAISLAITGVIGAPAAAVPGLVGLAWMRLQDRRVKKWWKLVVDRAARPAELAEKIEAGLAEDDENVVAGVVGGARAASAAIELAAVPVIAELSRRYFQEHDLPRWFYRGALEVLERVDAAELGAVRQMFVEIREIRSDSITIVGDIEGDRSWRAFQTSVTEPAQPLTAFQKPARLFGYLKRAGLGFDSSGFGIGGSPKVLVVDREPADWFRDALLAGLTS